MNEPRLDWHLGFLSALKLEFHPYQDALELLSEVPLNAKPLRIDVVIKKKPHLQYRHCERNEAIQCRSCSSGLLRRFAPRNDERPRIARMNPHVHAVGL